MVKGIYRWLHRVDDVNYCWRLRRRLTSSQPKAIKGIARHRATQLYKKALRRASADIPLEATIGPNITFPHGFFGIFISCGAVLGANCTIFQQVTIGSNTLPGTKKPGAPVIGDNVFIGAGAKIIGGVHIGNNVRIGANCVVTSDIPDNCTVVLPSPRVIQREETMTNNFQVWEEFQPKNEVLL